MNSAKDFSVRWGWHSYPRSRDNVGRWELFVLSPHLLPHQSFHPQSNNNLHFVKYGGVCFCRCVRERERERWATKEGLHCTVATLLQCWSYITPWKKWMQRGKVMTNPRKERLGHLTVDCAALVSHEEAKERNPTDVGGGVSQTAARLGFLFHWPHKHPKLAFLSVLWPPTQHY